MGRVLFAALLLAVACWHIELKPFLGEAAYLEYKMARGNDHSRDALSRAIKYDPQNSIYSLHAAQLFFNKGDPEAARDHANRAIYHFNGDVVLWSAYFCRGIARFKAGDLTGAKTDFETSLYYRPAFEPAINGLKAIKKIKGDEESER